MCKNQHLRLEGADRELVKGTDDLRTVIIELPPRMLPDPVTNCQVFNPDRPPHNGSRSDVTTVKPFYHPNLSEEAFF
jgi:hypothetical protein